MNIALPLRIGLCVLSGIGVAALRILQDGGYFGLENDLVFFPASGLLFAAGVLLPYLKFDDRLMLRALALVTGSTLSYYLAYTIVIKGVTGGYNNWVTFTTASVVGAAIVLAAFIFATPARFSRPYVLFGLAAGLIGGPITLFTLGEDLILTAFLGHAIWHTLIFLAIYFGTNTTRS